MSVNNELQPGDWWRRKHIKHARYIVDSVTPYSVYYTIPEHKRVFRMDRKRWFEAMEPCSADDVVDETGGIF